MKKLRKKKLPIMMNMTKKRELPMEASVLGPFSTAVASTA